MNLESEHPPEAAPCPGSIVEGVVAVVQRGDQFLMIQRAEGILAGGCWCFVGGGIEPGESQRAAVIREFFEEIGGRVRPERLLWRYTRPDGKLRLHWWLAELESQELRANPLEVQDFRWCTRAEIRGLPNVLESNLLFLDHFREAGETQ